MIRSDERVSMIDFFNKNDTVLHEGIAAFLENNQAIYKQTGKGQEERFIDIKFGYKEYRTVQEKFEVDIQDSGEYLGAL